MKIYCCHSKLFDFKKEFYEPIRSSKLNRDHEFIFPHETNEFINSKKIIKSCDLVIAEVSYPAIGEGVELGWADDAGVKIICVSNDRAKVSRSLSAISQTFITYRNADDLIQKITFAIN